MSQTDDLRKEAKLHEQSSNDLANDGDREWSCAYQLTATILQCTAALIESLPTERERAELAALTGLAASYRNYDTKEALIESARRTATELLKQRQADAEGAR